MKESSGCIHHCTPNSLFHEISQCRIETDLMPFRSILKTGMGTLKFFLFKKSKQKIQHKTKWTLVCNDWEMSFHRGSTIKEVYRSFEWMFINFVRYLCFPYQTILLWNKGKLWNKNYEELNFGLYSKTWVLRKVAISTVKCNMPGTKACFC